MHRGSQLRRNRRWNIQRSIGVVGVTQFTSVTELRKLTTRRGAVRSQVISMHPVHAVVTLKGETEMPKIPLSGIGEMPKEIQSLPEDIPYGVVVRRCGISPNTDKNGNFFLTGIDMEITEPDEWKGRHIFDNYIVLVDAPPPGSPLGVRRAIEDQRTRLERFIGCLRIPFDASGFDTESAIGCEGQVTVRNEEFQGRVIPHVQDYLQ